MATNNSNAKWTAGALPLFTSINHGNMMLRVQAVMPPASYSGDSDGVRWNEWSILEVYVPPLDLENGDRVVGQ